MAIIQSGVGPTLWTIDPSSNAGRVTLYDINGNAITGIGTIPINGVLSALNQTLEIELTGQANTAVQIYGTTGTLTISFQATINDGYSWFFVNAYSLSTDTPVTSTNGDGVWFIDVSGYNAVRLLVSAYTSGSTNASMIASPEERNVRSVAFLGFADNSTNSTNKTPVLSARANASAPTWVEGNQVPLSVDNAGNLRITGTISATSASISATGSSPPVSATYIAGSVTTTAPTYVNATMNALSLTTTGALRIDGSAVTQPISASSLPLPTGAATETTLGTRLADATFTTRINTLGQKTMTNSMPVVLASDQSVIPVSQSGSWTVTSNIGTTNGLALETTQVKLTIAQSASLGSNTQVLVGGSVTTAAPTYVTGNINPFSLTTQGSLRVDGSGSTQPISGTVTANAGTGNFNVVGTGSDNTTNSTAKLPVISAVANTSNPTYTSGNMVPLSTDTAGNLRVTGTITVDKSTASNITSVAGAISNTSILASNANRVLATIFNAANKIMYVALGGTASLSSYSVQIANNSYWELPVTYTGAISAVWASGVTGNALVTELT